jgi:hypothetical protein
VFDLEQGPKKKKTLVFTKTNTKPRLRYSQRRRRIGEERKEKAHEKEDSLFLNAPRRESEPF